MRAKLIRFAQFAFLGIVLAGLGWGTYTAVRYLRTAERFEVRKLSVSGLKRVAESQVLARVNFEFGKNVFLADLDEIRARVEELEWVRHAIVQRVLPDQIIIRVAEREPVGLARIRGEVFQFDADGTILGLDPVSDISFPILDGLRVDDLESNLVKVQTYATVLAELGQTELSEVHINEAGEVSVVSSSDPMIVNLGNEDYRTRWIKYLQLKTQIQQQYPDAVRVDLRFRDQVIVRMRHDDENGEQAVWDVEKRTL